MKYIEMFENFTKYSTSIALVAVLKKDVQDMFVELKDEGYNIFWYYKSPRFNYENYSEIRIYKFLGFDDMNLPIFKIYVTAKELKNKLEKNYIMYSYGEKLGYDKINNFIVKPYVNYDIKMMLNLYKKFKQTN